jgi:hypothetical protein
MDLGNPVSYLVLARGVPVITSDGQQIGTVEHVLAVPEADVFDGVIVDTGDGHCFADAPEIDRLYERGVVLSLDAQTAGSLPRPAQNPASMEVEPDDVSKHKLDDKLRRAWDYLSGRY